MLFARPHQAAHIVLDGGVDAGSLPEGAIWLDLLEPTEAERAQAAKICDFAIPTLQQLSEIESTSRIRRDREVLYMSIPLAKRRADQSHSSPVGLVLASKRLVTVRFSDYLAFDSFAKAVETAAAPISAQDLLLGLLEAMVDRLADVLEATASDLDRTSSEIFEAGPAKRRRNMDAALRGLLKKVGRSGDTLSVIRDSLLGLSRVVLFLESALGTATDPTGTTRLHNLERDLRSLSEFDDHVTNKVQFLLDATLGFINIDQNNGIRILTVVSLIGIPPTLIASIYGMNFKDIPELSWSFGYYYALGLMGLSVVLPLAWFRRVGWI